MVLQCLIKTACILMVGVVCYAGTDSIIDEKPIKHFKSMQEIRDINRGQPTQDKIDNTVNYSIGNLKDKQLKRNKYFRRNFSFSDFNNTMIQGTIFEECNFSFAVNLNKALVDANTMFIECNFTGIPESDLPRKPANVIDCHGSPMTDKEIEAFFADFNM